MEGLAGAAAGYLARPFIRYVGNYIAPRMERALGAVGRNVVRRYVRPRIGSSRAYRAGRRPVRRARMPPRRHANAVARAACAMLNTRTAGFLGVEHKFIDYTFGATTISNAAALTAGECDPATVNCLSAVAIGDNHQSRDGKKIVLESILIRGKLQRGAYENFLTPYTAINHSVFVALVLDTQTNGAQLNSEDVYINPSATQAGICLPVRNRLFSGRFRILKCEVFKVAYETLSTNDATHASAHATTTHFDWFLPFKNGLHINFNAGTTADVANVVDNSLHVIAFTDCTTFVPTLLYNARVGYQG